MDNLARQLAASIGTGVSLELRQELKSIFGPNTLTSLQLNLELFETPYRVLGSTPNLLLDSSEPFQQLILITPNESTGWEPVKKPTNRAIGGSVDQRSIPTLYYRILDDGVLHFKIELLDSGPAKVDIGMITATSHPEALNNLQLLRTLERLAIALSKPGASAILLEFNSSVGNALFGTSHPPSSLSSTADSLFDSDEEDAQTQRSNSSSLFFAGGIPSIWTHGLRLHNGNGGAGGAGGENRFFPTPFSLTAVNGGRSGNTRHITAGLTFTDPADEAHFQLWHATHMLQFDVFSLALCVLFHTLLIFTNIGPVSLYMAVEPWRWAFGYVQIALLPFLTNKRCRKFYIRHRDAFLLTLIAILLFYHQFVIRNVALGVHKCSGGVVYGFLWIPFTTLVLQARFKRLLPAIVLTTAINLTLLGEICAACDVSSSGVANGMHSSSSRRCSGRGGAKVVILVGAALCTVYAIEWRAIRVWAALRGASR